MRKEMKKIASKDTHEFVSKETVSKQMSSHRKLTRVSAKTL